MIADSPPSLLRVVAIPIAIVAAYFAIYELVERRFLSEARPELLHGLHLVRGVSGTAIGASLAAVLVLRRLGRTGTGSPLPPVRKGWRGRLRHASLGTKILFPMVALSVIPSLVVGSFSLLAAHGTLREKAMDRLRFDTQARAGTLTTFLSDVRHDLVFLGELHSVRQLARAPSAAAREDASRDMLLFSQGKRAFYQVRYLDGAGREVVRIDLADGLPYLVPEANLQDKSDRYYVREALRLGPGMVYVSPMDLNVEHGQVEIPRRLVVRYASSVPEGGAVIINLDGRFILSLIEPLPAGAHACLVDSSGTYAGCAGIPAHPESTHLADDHSRSAAEAILGSREAAATFEAGDSFLSACALSGGEDPARWILLLAHPREPIEAPIRSWTVVLASFAGMAVILAAVIAILVATFLARPVAALREATGRIASGDLSRRVRIETGDEIEGLAIDFNRMAESLLEARERLATWNRELALEVERRTGELHRLQSGFGRVEKIYSLGLVAASTLHEVGNPLGAIKAEIQVAREESEICEECTLLARILGEVDRLTSFLRSFSRLHRFPPPRVERVPVAELVAGAVALASPELRRRGIALVLESDPVGPTPCVSGDADRLRQVLFNLVLNAADASPGGGVVRIRTSLAADPDATRAVLLEVVDQGAGIPREVLEKVWDPFFTTKADGSGLGLTICQQIVAEHGGSISLENLAGGGAVARVAIPVARP